MIKKNLVSGLRPMIKKKSKKEKKIIERLR